MKKLFLLILYTLFLSQNVYCMDVSDAPEQEEKVPSLQQLSLEKVAQFPVAQILANIQKIPSAGHAPLAYLVLTNHVVPVTDKHTLLNTLSLEPHDLANVGLAVLLANLTSADKNALLNALITKIPANPDNNSYIQTLQLFTRRANETFNNGINTVITPAEFSNLPRLKKAKNSYTLVIDAIRSGNMYALRLLLANGADPNLAPGDDTLMKPLNIAFSTSNPEQQKESIALLLEAGANVQFGPFVHDNLFYQAAKNNNEELLTFLKEYAEINNYIKTPTPSTPKTLLDRVQDMTLIRSGLESIIKILKSHGAKTHAELQAEELAKKPKQEKKRVKTQ